MSNTRSGIPQVIAIVRPSGNGKVIVKKVVRNHLGAGDRVLYLVAQGEVLLTTREPTGAEPAKMRGNRLLLPPAIVSRLGLEKGALLAMIEREEAVALKKLEIEERPGDRARIVDVETAHRVTRVAQTNPMPKELLPVLRERYSSLELRHDVRGFLSGQRTLEAWKARRLLGTVEDTDEQLKEVLIRERLERQGEDGSWEEKAVLTARNLRELAELGVEPETDEARKGVQWLLSRPESPWNPGMFFATDGLVEEQIEIVEQRRETGKGRFRARKRVEMKLSMDGDETFHDPCGPRIMWPNAFVLEALLALGYEHHDRVQRALNTLMLGGWCECGYQHGTSGWRSAGAQTPEQVAATEARYVAQFRYGGISDLGELREMDASKQVGPTMPRVSHSTENGKDVFDLRMPTHQQPCELITVRALRQVRDPQMRRLAEAHLWRFAGRQQSPDGRFEGAYKHVGLYFYPQLFAGYDHPASKVAIMRSMPWIVDSQNENGSWGQDPHQDISTLVVVSALSSLGDDLPAALERELES